MYHLMHRPLRWLVPGLVISLIGLAAWRLWPGGAGPTATALDPAMLAAALPAPEVADTRDEQRGPAVDGDWTPDLPRDLGPHRDARTELWDLSGHLRDRHDDRYGFRLTLVRLALRPAGDGDARPSRLAADALLLGRFELIPADGEPLTAQRASRMAAGLAGAEDAPPRVWLEDWVLELAGADGAAGEAAAGAAGAGRLRAGVEGVGLDLALTPAKPALAPAAQLLDGGGRADRGPSFRWLAAPRLHVEGRLLRGDRELAVNGSAWLDKAWGEVIWGEAAGVGGLSGTRGQLALNRFVLQLGDGSELLCIHLRRRAGGGTPIPTCLAVAADGSTRVLRRRELTLAPTDTSWRSPLSDALYPVRWRLAAPALGLDLAIRAQRPDREVDLGERVWSGAVTVGGERDGTAIAGGGRMDLSGYVDGAGD
jgi:predicted secreted hydrolase